MSLLELGSLTALLENGTEKKGWGCGARERGTRGGQTLGADARRERADTRTERRTTYPFFIVTSVF
jgi:hypothetical protein